MNGRLQLGRAVRQVIPRAANLDAPEVDTERGEGVEVEGVGDRLDVVVEDRADRALGGQGEEVLGIVGSTPAQATATGLLPAELRRVLAQLAADRVEVG